MSLSSSAIHKALACCVLFGFAAGFCAARQSAQKQAKPSSSLAAGAKIYKRDCAVCHGNDLKGNGPPPASSPFTESPPDLTTLAKRHEGEFPTAYVKAVLLSGVKMADHGPAEMPVWGVIFKAATKSDETKVSERIADLTEFVKSLQAK